MTKKEDKKKVILCQPFLGKEGRNVIIQSPDTEKSERKTGNISIYTTVKYTVMFYGQSI